MHLIERRDTFRDGGIQPVTVGPVLIHHPERIDPVIEDLAALDMAADTPHVAKSSLSHCLMTDVEVVDVLNLERQVVDTILATLQNLHDMVVNRRFALVEPNERHEQPVTIGRGDII